MAYSDNAYAPEASSPADRAYADHAHAAPARGYSGERLAIWVLMILALAFWLPYTFMVDHGVFTALS